MKTEVAIIVRTKDRPILLRRALQSIVNQTYSHWNIVVVNNGGNIDYVTAVVEEFKYCERIMLINLEKSFGMETATNIGLNNSVSKYVALLDDDDTWHPEFLMKCIEVLTRDPLIDGVVTQTYLIYEQIINEKINEVSRKPFNINLSRVTIWRLARKNLYTTNSFVYKRKALETVGFYREELPVLGDWEFNIRFILKNRIKVIQYPLAYYHKRNAPEDKNYSNSQIIEHIKFDNEIRIKYFVASIKKGKYLFGFAIYMFGYLNYFLRILKMLLSVVTKRL